MIAFAEMRFCDFERKGIIFAAELDGAAAWEMLDKFAKFDK